MRPQTRSKLLNIYAFSLSVSVRKILNTPIRESMNQRIDQQDAFAGAQILSMSILKCGKQDVINRTPRFWIVYIILKIRKYSDIYSSSQSYSWRKRSISSHSYCRATLLICSLVFSSTIKDPLFLVNGGLYYYARWTAENRSFFRFFENNFFENDKFNDIQSFLGRTWSLTYKMWEITHGVVRRKAELDISSSGTAGEAF